MDNEDEFGRWLSGFTDGDGYFGITIKRNKGKNKVKYRVTPCFTIALHADDLPVLRSIRDMLWVGRVSRIQRSPSHTNPQASYYVIRTDELAQVIVPQFDKYPLRSKKALDFKLWREIVLMRAKGLNYVRENWREIWLLALDLRDQRKYDPPIEYERYENMNLIPVNYVRKDRKKWLKS